MTTAYDLAKAEVGTVEWAKGDNPKVVAYFKDSGNPGVMDDETAWCAAFVGAMLRRAGVKSTGALNARSYLDWGTPVDRKNALPGDVVIFKRGSSSWQGHVAFFVKDRGALIDVLGGNQSNAVNVKGYQSAALLGIRRPPKATAKPAKPAKRPAQIAKPAAQPSPAKPGSGAVAALLGGALVLIGAKIDAITAWASEWAHWAASFFN
jgi:uncharacterized protein (TIGR02594 family)